MKKTFFKLGLFLALGLTIVVFNSCEKDDDTDGGINDGTASKITATNVINGTAQIITVKALADFDGGDDDDSSDAIAQAPYQNNGFTLELPATLGAKYLTLDTDGLYGISVSDRNVKFTDLNGFEGYNEDDVQIGYFVLEEEKNDSDHHAVWIYVDRDVTIKGEVNEVDKESATNDKYIYDLTLNKGWNNVYEISTDSYENDINVYSTTMTSNKPSGVNYTWRFYDDGF